MAAEKVVVPASTAHSEAVADFTAWVADHHRPLLEFAQLVAGDASTAEDLLQTALARAYLKWSSSALPTSTRSAMCGAARRPSVAGTDG